MSQADQDLVRAARAYVQRWQVVMYCYGCGVYECVGFDGDILEQRDDLSICGVCGHYPRTVVAADVWSEPRFKVVEGGKK